MIIIVYFYYLLIIFNCWPAWESYRHGGHFTPAPQGKIVKKGSAQANFSSAMSFFEESWIVRQLVVHFKM